MNWLSIAVVVFLILMAAFGAKRGLVRMIMSFAAALLALGIVALIDQPLEQAIREHTLLEETIENTVRSYVEESIQSAAGSTAVRVQKTIDNLMLPETLKASLREGNTPFIIRMPLIPGVNDEPAHFEAVAARVEGAKALRRVEFLPYHKTAGAKYSLVGMKYSPEFDVNRPVQIDPEPFNKRGIPVVTL